MFSIGIVLLFLQKLYGFRLFTSKEYLIILYL